MQTKKLTFREIKLNILLLSSHGFQEKMVF